MAHVYIVKSVIQTAHENNESKRRIYSTLKSARKVTREIVTDDRDRNYIIKYDDLGHFRAGGQMGPYREFSVTVKKMRILGPDLSKGEEDSESEDESEEDSESDNGYGGGIDEEGEEEAPEKGGGIKEDVGDEVEVIPGYRRQIY